VLIEFRRNKKSLSRTSRRICAVLDSFALAVGEDFLVEHKYERMGAPRVCCDIEKTFKFLLLGTLDRVFSKSFDLSSFAERDNSVSPSTGDFHQMRITPRRRPHVARREEWHDHSLPFPSLFCLVRSDELDRVCRRQKEKTDGAQRRENRCVSVRRTAPRIISVSLSASARLCEQGIEFTREIAELRRGQ